MAENHNNIEDAIKFWVQVSELTLKASKNPKIDFNYKNMLLNRTKSIIEHIKLLKTKKEKTIDTESSKMESGFEIEQEKIEDLPQVPSNLPINQENTLNMKKKKDQRTDSDVKVKKPPKKSEVIGKSDFKNLPEGVKEIKTSEEFDVLTPYDKNNVEARLNQDIDLNIFKFSVEEESNSNETIPNGDKAKTSKRGNKIICFACGEENPPSTKKCKNCGTDLS